MKFKEIDIKKTISISIIVVISVILSIYITRLILKKFVYVITYDKYVSQAASETNIDPYLIFAIIKQESKFDKYATSKKEAKGLMQILDSTAKEIAQTEDIDLYDAKTNISIGTKYFKSLVDRYEGNIHLAICAYNAGLGNVDKWMQSEEIYSNGTLVIANIPFNETKEYLTNILSYYDKYVELYG